MKEALNLVDGELTEQTIQSEKGLEMKNKKTSAELEKDFNKVIKIDEAQIHSHLDSMVRETVEETLNRMLNEEADRLCNAQRYEHTDCRVVSKI